MLLLEETNEIKKNAESNGNGLNNLQALRTDTYLQV